MSTPTAQQIAEKWAEHVHTSSMRMNSAIKECMVSAITEATSAKDRRIAELEASDRAQYLQRCEVQKAINDAFDAVAATTPEAPQDAVVKLGQWVVELDDARYARSAAQERAAALESQLATLTQKLDMAHKAAEDAQKIAAEFGYQAEALKRKLEEVQPQLDYYKRQFDGALAQLTPAYAERDKLLFELQAARDAFKPVEDWYDGDNEDGVPLRTFPQMIADAVADLQHDRKESNEYRKSHPEDYCKHGTLKGHCPDCP